ncbi:MAG: hypothetical protein P9M03_02710 [Candidatus Theseobacter exili]|nr:hypothetical protein [Candidatus Theseobacter exili]
MQKSICWKITYPIRVLRDLFFPSGKTRCSENTNSAPDLAFVSIIEKGILEEQGLLLYRSIRKFGGRFSSCPIYAYSPRPNLEISNEARQIMKELGVIHVEKHLSQCIDYYPQANRAFVMADLERRLDNKFLVIVDNDTVFVDEPAQLELKDGVDVAACPVDVKGICTTGLDDESDWYWQELCTLCNVDYNLIPFHETSVDRTRIKACYNGGLIVFRRNKGICNLWEKFMVLALGKNLFPRKNISSIKTGTGVLDSKGAQAFNTAQTTLALAIWFSTQEVKLLELGYNYPLHLYNSLTQEYIDMVKERLVHIHYHWLFEANYLENNVLFDHDFGLKPEITSWLRSITPLRA